MGFTQHKKMKKSIMGNFIFGAVLDFIYDRDEIILNGSISQREKCPYSELFWSVFSRIRTEYRISPYSARMRENTDQNNSKYGHFLRSVSLRNILQPAAPQGSFLVLSLFFMHNTDLSNYTEYFSLF